MQLHLFAFVFCLVLTVVNTARVFGMQRPTLRRVGYVMVALSWLVVFQVALILF